MPKLPAWVASQIGLGVANALIIGYRSYERVQYMFKFKVKRLTSVRIPLRSRRAAAGQTGTDVAESSATGPRIRINSEVAVANNSTFALLPESNASAHTETEVTAVTGQSASAATALVAPGRPSSLEIVSQSNELLARPGAAIFFLKPMPKSDRRIIDVYNNQGEKVYVLLRPAAQSQTWTLAYADAEPDARTVATIYAGKKDGAGVGSGIIAARARPGKYILFNNPNGGLTYRKVSKQWTAEDGNMRTFYLTGASPYHWTKAGFLQRSVFRDSEYFLTDPAVETPAEVNSGATGMGEAWGALRRDPPAYSFSRSTQQRLDRGRQSPITARTASRNSTTSTSIGASLNSRATAPHSRRDPRPNSAAPQQVADAPREAGRHEQRETIAYACKVRKGMVWRIVVDTNVISPDIVLATAWISILNQWGGKVSTRGIKLPEGL
ncbi:uncharacterized protein V2V93DRAFT_382848 [Kockiozyma suomiensis]|uniref:uncharacterized protein n=1 Tax=Kockiozyma suomiensis TaxID=1337062 RepID=UPI003343E5AF